jgi:hypothetical protein
MLIVIVFLININPELAFGLSYAACCPFFIFIFMVRCQMPTMWHDARVLVQVQAHYAYAYALCAVRVAMVRCAMFGMLMLHVAMAMSVSASHISISMLLYSIYSI